VFNPFAKRPAVQIQSAPDLILDVRTADEFADGHIPNAKNIPVQELAARMHEVGHVDQSIVVYCRSGARSATAKTMLQRAGYAGVLDIGPMSAWRSD